MGMNENEQQKLFLSADDEMLRRVMTHWRQSKKWRRQRRPCRDWVLVITISFFVYCREVYERRRAIESIARRIVSVGFVCFGS